MWKPGIGRDVEGDKAEGRSPVPKGLEPQLKTPVGCIEEELSSVLTLFTGIV